MLVWMNRTNNVGKYEAWKTQWKHEVFKNIYMCHKTEGK